MTWLKQQKTAQKRCCGAPTIVGQEERPSRSRLLTTLGVWGVGCLGSSIVAIEMVVVVAGEGE
jgi:hypothetical protein